MIWHHILSQTMQLALFCYIHGLEMGQQKAYPHYFVGMRLVLAVL